MAAWDECVTLSVNEEHWTLYLLHQLHVVKSLSKHVRVTFAKEISYQVSN